MLQQTIQNDPFSAHQHHYVYAFAGEDEANSFIRINGSQNDRDQLGATLKNWQLLRPRVMDTLSGEAGLADTITIKDIPDEHHDAIQKVVDQKWFQLSYPDQTMRFGMVEIDKLVAPQRSVDVAYCDQLKKSWPANMTSRDLLNICFGIKDNRDTIHHLETGRHTHVFSSSNTDVRVLSTYVQSISMDDFPVECGGIPLKAIISVIGTGTPVIHTFKIGNRMILNNGFHRVFALRSMGFKEIPVLISEISSIELEMPEILLGLPREYLAHEPRPVLMKDFFEPDFSVLVNIQKRQRVIQMNTVANVFDVPL